MCLWCPDCPGFRQRRVQVLLFQGWDAWQIGVVHWAVGVLRRKPTDRTSCSDQE